MIVGIDFGTCYSSVAIMVGDTSVRTSFFKEQTELGIPSKYLYHEGIPYYGINCDSVELIDYKEDIIDEIKKKVRENPENLDKLYYSGGKKILLRTIIKNFFKYLLSHAKIDAVSLIGANEAEKIDEITVARPVGISDGSTAATLYNELLESTILELTGLPRDKIHLIDEPSAAAMSYLYKEDMQKNFTKDQKILVFDLGGGTFDLSLDEYHPTSLHHKIIDTDGALDLGGGNWDEELEKLVCTKYNYVIPQNKKKSFREKIVQLKIALSKNEKGIITLEDENHLEHNKEISRKEFESATEHLLERTLNVMSDFIKRNDLDLTTLDKIVLVGGSSNMPQIKNGILTKFPELNESDVELYDASTAISQGAARYSKIKNGAAIPTIIKTEITAQHTYGIRVFDPDYNRYRILNVIFKGDRFYHGVCHAEPSAEITPPSHNRTHICLRIYESNEPKRYGDEYDLVDENENIQFNGLVAYHSVPTSYLQSNKQYKVNLELDLSANGVLEITFIDTITKKRTKGELCQEDD